jgi:hypothetical protein
VINPVRNILKKLEDKGHMIQCNDFHIGTGFAAGNFCVGERHIITKLEFRAENGVYLKNSLIRTATVKIAFILHVEYVESF